MTLPRCGAWQGPAGSEVWLGQGYCLLVTKCLGIGSEKGQDLGTGGSEMVNRGGRRTLP